MNSHFENRLHPATRNAGFTLMEILMASAILIVVILLLVALVEGASRLWRNGEHQHEALSEIRAGLQVISEDLHSAVITTNSDSFLIEQGDFMENGSTFCKGLFFLVSHAEDRRQPGSKGDLCAAGYFVAAAHDGVGPRNLYRFHLEGKQVADAVGSGDIKDLYALASPTNTTTTELLARNIFDFEIHALPENLPSPEALEITLSALNGETENIMASDPKATSRNAVLQERNLHRYTTIVHLPPPREVVTPGS